MDQTVWNTLHGRLFTFVDPDGVVETLRLSAHADFILVLITPFYWLYESPITLLVIQTLVITLGGYFVYLIALNVLSSQRVALVLTLGYYLNYFVQEQNVFDFHAVSLATTFLLGAFYFLIVCRYKWFTVMLVLAVLTKENVYLVAALFGILLWRRHYKWHGVALFLGGIITFFVLMAYLIPAARTGSDHFALSYLSYLGDSPAEILLSPILKPALFFGHLFSSETLDYIRMALLPVGFVSLLAPFYLIFLLPDFLINVMSSNENLRSIQYHYGALLVPFIYISAIYGVKTLQKFSPWPRATVVAVSYYFLAMSLYSTYLYGLLPGTRQPDLAVFQTIPHQNEIHESLNAIPPDASVAASNSLAAHLSHRRFIYVLPLGVDLAEYIAVYKTHLSLAEDLTTYENTHVVVDRIGNDYVLLKRVSRSERAVSL